MCQDHHTGNSKPKFSKIEFRNSQSDANSFIKGIAVISTHTFRPISRPVRKRKKKKEKENVRGNVKRGERERRERERERERENESFCGNYPYRTETLDLTRVGNLASAQAREACLHPTDWAKKI